MASSRTNIAVTGLLALGTAFQAQAETVDSAKNYQIIEGELAKACVSNRSSHVQNCTATMMNATLGVAQAFEKYLDRNHAGHNAAYDLHINCKANFEAIAAKYESDQYNYGIETALPEYFKNGFLGSQKCLETIEEISAHYDLNYMPSTRTLLYQKIEDARNKRIVRGWSL